MKGNSVCQVMEFRAFLCVGGCKSLGLLESSLHMHLSPPGPAFCVFTSRAAMGLTGRSGCSLKAGILLLPSALGAHIGVLGSP